MKLISYVWGGLLHFAHRIFTPLMIFVILYALLVVGVSSLTPWARLYRPQISQLINHNLGQNLEFSDIETAWYGVYPVVKLIDVKLDIPGRKPWVCHELWLGLDVLRSILYWHLHPGLLYVDGLDLNFKQDFQGQWLFEQSVYLHQTTGPNVKLFNAAMQWVVHALAYMPEKILLKNIHLFVIPQHAQPIDMNHVLILGQKKTGRYLWSAEAKFARKSMLIARADMPLLSSLQLPEKGRLYVQAKEVNLSSLPWGQDLRQWLGLKKLQGQLNAEAWIDWQERHLAAVHVNFLAKNLGISGLKSKFMMFFSQLSANSLWQKTVNGWELSVDHLNVNDQQMQDNQLLLYYQGDWNNYHMYVKDFPLSLLKKIQQLLPKTMLQTFWSGLQGRLQNLQLNVKDGAMDYFLAQFDNLSLPVTAGHPGVQGLRGVFSWEPATSHLEISSEHLKILFAGLAPLDVETVYGSMTTFPVQQQTRLHIDRLVLARPGLAMTLHGEVDEPLNAALRNLRLQMKWSLENAEFWRAYLSVFLPPSDFRKWLQYDVKHIGRASGELILNGLGKDFPYDHDEGEFSVNAYLYDVDLVFAPSWPLVKHIDGRLLAHQRQLEVRINKGDLGAHLPIQQLSLLAPDLGLNHEHLLIHGQLTAPVREMVHYLQQTPLQTQMKSWEAFDLQGDADLDLKLDIPLEKSSSAVLSLGHLSFPEQKLNLKMFVNPLPVNRVHGFLDFDGDGVMKGQFHGFIGHDPFKFVWQDEARSDSTVFNFQGSVDATILKLALNMSATSFMEGHFPLQGQIIFPRLKNRDIHMVWDSSLQGLSLDLPQPWYKTATEIKPLHLDIHLTTNQLLNFFVDYQNTQWHILMHDQQWTLETQQQNLAGTLIYDLKSAKISAQLDRLWLTEDVLDQRELYPSRPWKIKDLPDLDVVVNDFRWQNFEFGQLKVNAQREKKQWSMKELSLTSPYYGFLLRGDVSFLENQYQTNLTSELRISKLAQTLETWHITPVADCKDGYLGFEGGWRNASLNQIHLKTLDGQLLVLLKRGNISHLDKATEQKIGIGKLLSILSLQTLPRRLQLDFSDLANKGFTFDIFKGNFNLHDGLLKTENAVMDGPIAHVKIQGDLNVLDRWYDLELQVYPYITASLPVVATIAGGPLAGVATWAANHVINQGMQKISAYTYKISGPWTQPVVQQVKLLRKH